ncbi:MAG TPA: UDP-N-acetylglucosamine 2-epimerase (non-hydrolyzing) [Armatimonadetes bacterium]|nr:UDP-N-acetylglucosamine 2-epimerase (non-hydrolyzing) [Armatimonadota bacterium]
MAPLIRALRARPNLFRVTTLVTAQHREMVDQVLQVFDLPVDHDLNLMQPGQTLPDLTARVITNVTPVLQAERPDLVLVQGDTTTVLASALAAFYEGLTVGHVEAGLRTATLYDPFPEEMNRRLTTRLASLHFAATSWSADNLAAEGVTQGVYITGNTVIDALQSVAREDLPLPAGVTEADLEGRRLLLTTAHRRENLGEPLSDICHALADLARRHEDVVIVYAMHRNPRVRETVQAILGSEPRVVLIEPPDYFLFVGLLRRAALVLTDSGGIQEEAPALGKPVLVLRRTTERPEGVDAGTAQLVGTNRAAIVAAASLLLDRPEAYDAMARAVNPYGDGKAAERIADAIAYHFQRAPAPRPFGVGRSSA